ncbi:MAG TPA: signal peptidase I, partial [Candidatus Eremiobacteraceae bacterium]|nr:signal peptidase I [Candidatus Eremiobacteraceae bacterium]
MPRSLEGTLEARSSALGSVAREVELERSVRHQKFARRLIRLSAELLLLAALISLCFLRFPQVEGHSMQPNIETGNHVLINTLAYEVHIGGLVIGRHAINRGDVVAFPRRDADEQRLFLKRVVGLPGDAVAIRHGA